MPPARDEAIPCRLTPTASARLHPASGGGRARWAQRICSGNCNLDAAGGAYVDPQGQLYVYGTTHDNDGVPYNGYGDLPDPLPDLQCAGPECTTEFGEFRPVPHDTCADIEDSWVELYAHTGFGGRSLMVDFVDRHLEDYTNFDRAEDFEDSASSIRWCIAPGATLRLWEDKDACGGNHADFVGSGRFHVDSDLDGFGDAASCAEWRGGPFARAGRDRTAECTGETTTVQLNGSASISLPGEPLTFSWLAAGVTFDDSGSATPIGSFPQVQTTVTLTVSDSAGSDSDTVNVAVVDTIAPTITCPANVVVDATMPSGSVVNYPAPMATDSCSAALSVMCAASSGSTFEVGTSTVQCTVTDGANNASACSFTVKVRSPAEQAAALIEKINALVGVKDAMKTSLIAKVEAALMSIAGGNTAAACWDLLALLQAVQAQSGKQLTSTQAADLIADITRIRAALGCS